VDARAVAAIRSRAVASAGAKRRFVLPATESLRYRLAEVLHGSKAASFDVGSVQCHDGRSHRLLTADPSADDEDRWRQSVASGGVGSALDAQDESAADHLRREAASGKE